MSYPAQSAVQQNLELAFARLKAGRIQEADILCRELLAQNPGHPDILNVLGMIAGLLQRREIATALFQKAITQKPRSVPLQANLGAILLERGMAKEAMSPLRKAVDGDPENYGAVSGLLRARQMVAASQSSPPSEPSMPEIVANFQNIVRKGGLPLTADDIFGVVRGDISDFTAMNTMPVMHWPIRDDHRIPMPDWSRFPQEWQSFWPIFEERAQRGLVMAREVEFWARKNTIHFDVFSKAALLVERDFQIPHPSQPTVGTCDGLLVNMPGFQEAIIGLRNDTPTHVIEEPAIFLNGCDIYGHYLLDILPKLAFCALDPVLAEMPIYCSPILPYQAELLALLKLDHLNFRPLDLPRGGTLHFKQGYLPGHVPYPYAVHWFRQQYARHQPAATRKDRRLFLSRANMPVEKRRLANEEEVQAFLQARGFETLYPEQMPVQEVARHMAEAAIVVSPVGSTVNNMVFAPPGTPLIELITRDLLRPEHVYWMTNHPLIAYLQVNYQRVLGDPVAGGPTVIDSPMRISLDDLAACLGPLLAGDA